ncbi:sensor histidine kinase [Nocardia seriolae]|uniref:histidine kinase n=1 Tax=Nocardia seriolae TaxID=37332 RepID=A0ABC8AMB4_9NOCA|nr:HAMP domain-containing sensor histidine kinase [Nocardia seriolae]APA95409.1 Histidine kinase [Nocardia seriolae]MTJ66450.1 HAMP domain-containing protein [Nocardia seriolae]MTJ76198.1 HAMP domain-containing protein [Nocardia seriolae]MTJ85652.1 HAMP domain-containing protein [Nocardia seriolae]MTK29649.1 HAMP domain-containing protein [Nocardia seriolae]
MSSLRGRVADRLAAVPLRTTLVLALVSLVGFGLLVSGIAVTSLMRNVLVERIDRQLYDAAHSWAAPGAQRPEPLPTGRVRERPPHLYWVQVTDTTGQVTLSLSAGVQQPEVPADLGTRPRTVGSVAAPGEEWRVLRTGNQFGTSTVALRMDETNSLLDKLIVLQLVIGALVLAALAAVARIVIRRSLRPLREMERTAAAIAGGDLHQRVPVRGTDTEVDHLSQSLNTMLTQIQQAFAATEASEEAARSSEAKMRRFVADASHELRTPLTSIKGFAELYRQGAITDPDLLTDRIERESKRMGLLVEDLLMLARLDAQRPVERRPVDLLMLASDAVHSARALAAAERTAHPDAPERKIDLEIRPGPGTLELLGDEARLRQVLANLINNALVHTPAEAEVAVRLTPAEREVLIEVADTGPGLDAEQAEKVFERFYRADSSRSRVSGGTGLGLSIVQALVAAHGGRVSVTSAPGEGTTFTVRLPRDAS